MAFITQSMPREERVAVQHAPTGSTVRPSKPCNDASLIWSWWEALRDDDARSHALVISPEHAALIQHLAALSASVQPGSSRFLNGRGSSINSRHCSARRKRAAVLP